MFAALAGAIQNINFIFFDLIAVRFDVLMFRQILQSHEKLIWFCF